MTFAAPKLGVIALPLFLAESTTDSVRSSTIGELLVGLAALAVLVMSIWSLIDRIRGGSTQKNEISFAAQLVTQKEFGDFRAEVDKVDQGLRKEVEKVDHERRTSVAGLHAKIDGLSSRLDDRIDQIPGRTIALLNETKQLHRAS